MISQEIQNYVKQQIQSASSANRFQLTPIQRHVHNGTDSPNIPGTSVTTIQTILATPGGVLDPKLLNGQGFAFLGQLDVVPVLQIPIPIIYGSGTTTAITFTGALSAGAVSGTLTGSWGGVTGVFGVQFSSSEVRNAQFTNGSTAVTWQSGLTTGATSSATQIANARFKGGNAVDGTTIFFRNDDDLIQQLWIKSAPGAVINTWFGVNFGGTGLTVL